jgi:hypothetical protein
MSVEKANDSVMEPIGMQSTNKRANNVDACFIGYTMSGPIDGRNDKTHPYA